MAVAAQDQHYHAHLADLLLVALAVLLLVLH
jgi:hypothetical protein